jgi:hypothetical protein
MEVIQFQSIQRMILPEGWIKEPARPGPPPGALMILGALRVYHPPPAPWAEGKPFHWYDPAQVSLTLYSSAPPGNLGDALVLKLLTERPHHLTVQEASSLNYFTKRAYPPDIHWQDMRTEVWNHRIVLIAEGAYAGNHEFLMLVDNRSDIRIPKLPPWSRGAPIVWIS